MDCPKCEGQLQQQQLADEAVAVCSECAGIWLRYGQLPSLLVAWSQGMEFQRAAHNDLPKSTGPYVLNWDQVLGYCPLCSSQTAMIPSFRDVGGGRIRVDYCQRGHGIWLDASEIRNIQSRIRHKTGACEDMLRRILTITADIDNPV
jgi:Zn-finger nucleic acid-binding protein